MDEAFTALRALLLPCAAERLVQHDTPDNYYLEQAGGNGKPELFAAVQRKKSYIAFHLFPLYTRPALLERVPRAAGCKARAVSILSASNRSTSPRLSSW